MFQPAMLVIPQKKLLVFFFRIVLFCHFSHPSKSRLRNSGLYLSNSGHGQLSALNLAFLRSLPGVDMLLLMLGISGETGKRGEHPEKLGVCKPVIQTSVSKRHPLYVMMCEVHRHFRLSRLSSWKVYLFLTQKDVFQTCLKGQRLHQSLQVFVDWFQGLSQEPSQENQD